MESAQYAIYSALSSTLLADYSHRVQGLTFASNNRGWAECSGFVPMGLDEAFSLYDHAGLLSVVITDSASGTVYAGRLEDVAITGDGVTLTALGYGRSLSDAPSTALWSATGVGDWRPIRDSERGDAQPDRYTFDTNNRLYMAPQKNSSLGTTTCAYLLFQCPDDSTRDLIGIDFAFEMLLPSATWRVQLLPITTGFSAGAAIFTLNGTGALQTGARHLTFSATPWIAFQLQFNAAAAVFVGESGSAYAKILGVRLITTTANRVNTTLTIARTAGAGVTATVGSTARMYVGQTLIVRDSGSALGERVVVASIPSATTFTATFVANYAIGATVQAHVVYADEIARDLIAVSSTLNAGQLSSATTLVASPGLDLLNERYEDRLPSDILDYLASIGDAALNGWEWGVRDAQQLYFRAKNAQRTWYIDVSDLDIQRTLDQLANSVYAVYSDTNNRAQRTAATADSASVARYGLTRRTALAVSSTSATQAASQQAAALADGREPKPRSSVTISQVFDAGGSRWPLWAVAAGDTVVIRNLSPSLSLTIDRIRSFRLARVAYQFDTDTLLLEPELPRPTLEALLAHQALK